MPNGLKSAIVWGLILLCTYFFWDRPIVDYESAQSAHLSVQFIGKPEKMTLPNGEVITALPVALQKDIYFNNGFLSNKLVRAVFLYPMEIASTIPATSEVSIRFVLVKFKEGPPVLRVVEVNPKEKK